MKPLLILLSTFALSLLVGKTICGEFNVALSVRIAISVMLLFTSIGHFIYTKGMAMMIPAFIPYKETIVYLTGLLEILMAVCLLIPHLVYITGWTLIIFLILMLPANIYSSINNINYQKGTLDGNGLNYLWFRVPLQLIFIALTYFSTILS